MVQERSNLHPNDPDAAQGGLARLADLIRAHAPYDGHFNLRLPGLEVVRASKPNQERIHAESNIEYLEDYILDAAVEYLICHIAHPKG